MRRARLASLLVAVALFGMPAAAFAAPPTFVAPKRHYLALGDSIPYGYTREQSLAGLPPSAFTSYVDRFAARLRLIRDDVQVTHYSCPEERTATFIAGPCPWLQAGRALHDAFAGSQLEAAERFLRAHPGKVSPITLTLWANDTADLVTRCAGDLACIQAQAPSAIAAYAVRLRAILTRLRAAAPRAKIIVTGVWNNFVGLFPQTDPLFRTLDDAIAAVSIEAGTTFADTLPVFNPQGDVAVETATFCTLMLTCSAGDPHPTEAGHDAIAGLLLAASGYATGEVDDEQ